VSWTLGLFVVIIVCIVMRMFLRKLVMHFSRYLLKPQKVKARRNLIDRQRVQYRKDTLRNNNSGRARSDIVAVTSSRCTGNVRAWTIVVHLRDIVIPNEFPPVLLDVI